MRGVYTLQHAVSHSGTEPTILNAKDIWTTGGALRSSCDCLVTKVWHLGLHPSWYVLCTPFFLQQQALASVSSGFESRDRH